MQISVRNATAVGLGAIIGAGIFVLSGTAVALAGPYSLLAFILVGIVALILAMIMSELGSIMPYAKGASYSFAYNAFGSEIGFITGIALYMSFATAIGAIALGFGSYLASLVGLSYARAFAILIILALAVVNILGISKAAKTDFVLVAIKLSILALFAAFAIFFASRSGFSATASNFSAKGFELGSIFAASVAVFFAYSGFQTISTFTSKIKGGSEGAKKAIVGSVVISLVVYVLIDVSLLMLAPASSYRITADPLSFALHSAKAPQWIAVLVDVGALIATTSAALAMILSSARISYQLSEDGLLPRFFRKYDEEKDVPVNGVWLASLIGIAVLFAGNIYVIASISNFGLLISYLITALAQIHFRRQNRKINIRTPFYPYSTVLVIVLLLAFLFGMPRESLLVGNIVVLFLLIIYYFFRELKNKKPVKIRIFD